jgi:hypothetical protein
MVTCTTGTDTYHVWAGCPSCWAAAGSNGAHITWPANSARFSFTLGTMPQQPPAGGESYLKDIVFCPGDGPCGPLPPPPPPPRASTVTIDGPRLVERPPAIPGHKKLAHRRARFTATVKDQYGKPISAPDGVRWSVHGGTGVSISNETVSISVSSATGNLLETRDDAVVTVDSTQLSDATVTITATASSATGKLTVGVQRAVPLALTITGPTAVKLGKPATLNFTAMETDQFRATGNLPGAVTWSLLIPHHGVTIDPAKGTVEISASAALGVVTVTASTSQGHLNGTLSVALGHYDEAFFLQTSDTAITVVVEHSQISLLSLQHPAAGWDWLDGLRKGSVLPLPTPSTGAGCSWVFVSSDVGPTQANLTFTCGSLTLWSVWEAAEGGGPIQNSVSVHNSGTVSASFNSSLLSANLRTVPPQDRARFQAYSKTGVNMPCYTDTWLASNSTAISLPTGGPTSRGNSEGQYFPFAILSVGDLHGFYVGSEWELGLLSVETIRLVSRLE